MSGSYKAAAPERKWGPKSMEWIKGDYRISDDSSLLSIDGTYHLLSANCQPGRRSKENVRISIENAICYGVYHCGTQVGFARVVTDRAAVYWLCDVVIDEGHRRKGLGKRLIECILASPELRGLLGILATSDAHGLYERYGFERDSRQFMLRRSA